MEGQTSSWGSRNRITCLTLQEHDDDDEINLLKFGMNILCKYILFVSQNLLHFGYCTGKERLLHYTALTNNHLQTWRLTLILQTWRIWWAHNNASKWQMGFNSAFRGLKSSGLWHCANLCTAPTCWAIYCLHLQVEVKEKFTIKMDAEGFYNTMVIMYKCT